MRCVILARLAKFVSLAHARTLETGAGAVDIGKPVGLHPTLGEGIGRGGTVVGDRAR